MSDRLLADEDQSRLIAEWNNTDQSFPTDRCVHTLFEAQVEATPDAVAVVFDNARLTYRDLNQQANRLARRLRASAVRPESMVGIYLEHSLDMIVAIMAVWKAGGAYLPLDTRYPDERLKLMLDDAGVRTVLAHRTLLADLPDCEITVICLDAEREQLNQQSPENLPNLADAQNLAFMLYTSGSTGRPKGVMLCHANLVNAYFAWEQAYELRAGVNSHCQITNFSFAVFQADVVRALCSGGKLVLCSWEVASTPSLLYPLMVREQVNFAEFVPALLRNLFHYLSDTGQKLDLMKLLVVGSDRWYVREHLSGLQHCGPQTRFIHSFGLTETSIDTALFEGTDENLPPHQLVPIGRPFANIHVHIVDSDLQPVAIGVAGEMFIGGAGVSRGYLNHPELTAEKYLPDPYSSQAGGRLYRTGDSARRLPDGQIEFLGRLDQQVKLRGFRIEPGEVEAALETHLQVRQAVAVLRQDVPADPRLVAYFVATAGGGDESPAPTASELRQYLRQRLPEHMVPTHFVALAALPLSPNGKVDRGALPAPSRSSLDPTLDSFVAPATPTEGLIAALWAEVLGIEQISATENFFDLGGHSLLAAQVVARLRQAVDAPLTVRQLFEAPTVAGLAAVIEPLRGQGGGHSSEPALVRQTRAERRLPLSYAQQRLWFLDQLQPGSAAYNVPAILELPGELGVQIIERALTEVVRRHEALRTSFRVIDDHPVQVMARPARVRVRVVEVREGGSEQARRVVAAEAGRAFDLGRGPLFRAVLVRDGTACQRLLVVMHHIISDGWSVGVLAHEVRVLCQAFAAGQPAPLAELPVQYADYALWQRQWLQGTALEEQLSYWREQLKGAPPVLELATDRARPSVASGRGGLVLGRLDREIAERAREVARQEGATLFMLLLAALQALLSRYTGQEDLVVGVPVANRARQEVEGLIGFFVNTLAMRGDVSGDPSFVELVGRVREACLGGFAHQEVPFERVVEELRPGRAIGRHPLFQVAFVMHQGGAASAEEDATDQATETWAEADWAEAEAWAEAVAPAPKFDLTLMGAADARGELRLAWEFDADLFDRSTIQRLARHFETLFSAAVDQPEQRVEDLPLLAPGERRQLLVGWNDTHVEYAVKCLHRVIEAQVEHTPDAVAVDYQNEQLTYAELNRRANQLAHHLRRLGVGPESLVGVLMERSSELVVSLLAVLKAGGAYVPLDPGYPAERLCFMLEDCAAQVVLTQGRLRGMLGQLMESAGPSVVAVDEDWAEIARASDENLTGGAEPDNLAYVIFTSGSTGRPKGAMNTHAAICNRLMWMQNEYGLTADDRVLQKTPFSFDVSVWEFFWPLMTGARLVVARPEGHKDSAYLVELIREQQITTLHFVPSMLYVFLEEPEVETLDNIKRVICSGEALSFDLQERFFARLQTPLHNLYGPTEAAVDVTYWACERANERRIVPIGHPVANTQIYLLDRHMRPVPAGVPGELYIGGVQLARGYLNRPDLTADKFIPHPYSDEPGARLYQTGDLARLLSDGSVEYLRRLDHQVKLRGFRIELGEIEAVIAQHPAVSESVIVVAEYSLNVKHLIAYLVPKQSCASALRRFLRLEQEGKLLGQSVSELPDGRIVVHQNKGETDFLYQEIFAEETYLQYGITLDEDSCIFDVGANIGLFALFMGLKFQRSTIYAFEPIPPIFNTLRLNAEIYGLNTRLFKCGLSNETRTERFTYYPHLSIISGRFADAQQERDVVKSFLLNEGRDGNGATASEEVLDELLSERLTSENFFCELRTVSEVIREEGIERIDLLKIDVEKSELDVLLGITEEDWSKIRQIIVEVHDLDGRLQKVASMLEGYGYKLHVQQDKALKDTPLYNIYAVRPQETRKPARADDDHATQVSSYQWSSPRQLIKDVRGFLKQRLPDHMVPTHFVALAALPLSPNGKVDRGALPAPSRSSLDPTLDSFVAPATPTEGLIAALWAEVLGIEQISATENFFDLGGHSLLAAQVVARLRQAVDAPLTVRHLFEAPTVEGLATVADQLRGTIGRDGGTSEPALVRQTRAERRLPLSYAQQRLWFLDQLQPGSAAYNVPAILELPGELGVQIIERALTEVVRRHEALRTSFRVIDDHPVQVMARPARVRVRVVEVREGGSEQARRVVAAEAGRAFDLGRGPLFRAVLVRDGTACQRLLVVMHHIISDGWSVGVLAHEVRVLCQAFAAGQPAPLAELPVQYADYALWQRQWLQGTALEEQLSYWREQLKGAPPVLELATDRARPSVASGRGGLVLGRLDREIAERAREVARQEGATLFMLLLAALQALLSRYTGQEDLVVGVPVANRARQEVEGLIGFFVNTLAMRGDVSGDPSFVELVRRVREACLGGFAHQEVPFERVVEELRPGRAVGRHPLFQVAFVMQQGGPSIAGLTPPQIDEDVESEEAAWAEEEAWAEVVTVPPKFDLTLIVGENAHGELRLAWEFDADLFDRSTIQRLSANFLRLLEGAVREPLRTVSALPLLSEAERELALREWNRTSAQYERGLTLVDLFERQAAQTPDAEAVAFENERLSYRELNERANCMAHHLRKMGVGPESRVGICVERSLEMLVSLLGVHKAGGAYIPLDPSYPAERLSFMLADAQAPVLLTQKHLKKLLRAHTSQVVYVDSGWKTIAKSRKTNPARNVTNRNLAYIIYTSGSTGRPKGVLIEHEGLLNVVAAQHEVFATSSASQVLQFASLSFDASIFEIMMALAVGGTLHMARREALLPGPGLLELLRERGITIVTLAPSALAALPFENLPDLQTINLAGEACPAELVRDWGADYHILNLYGPTETTIWATVAVIDGSHPKPPIGKPILNTQVYILDQLLQPVAIGVAGEMFIGGAGVSRGYLNHPELTAEKYLPDPYSSQAGGRLYRTGDSARRLPDGQIEFLGRLDQQVKLRGFRIEPGEVEAALETHLQVRQAVAVLRQDVPADPRLVAYFVATAGGGDESPAPTASELRQYLRQRLPEHMVPTHFVALAALPLSPNGKVDRGALPAPSRSSLDPTLDSFVAPATPTEGLIAALWAEVLGIEQISATENFFDLGGHSLLAAQVVARLRQAVDAPLTVRQLFEAPTVAGLAAVIEPLRGQGGGHSSEPALVRQTRAERRLPLSYAQQRLWFLDQLQPGSAAYNVPAILELPGELGVQIIERALTEVVRRHEALRTSFRVIDDHPVQVMARPARVRVRVVEVREGGSEQARRVVAAEAGRAFDLGRGPLFRAVLVRDGTACQRLLVVMHHIISDGWSVGVLAHEVRVLCQAFAAGQPAPLAELPVQYADYALWQRQWLQGTALEEQLSYWREQLKGAPPVLELATDRARPSVASGRGGLVLGRLDREIAERAREVARQEGATLFMLLLAAYYVLLFRQSGQSDLVVGTDVANRNHKDVEALIGFFTNQLALRTQVSSELNYRELLRQVKETCLGGFAHQQLPFEKLVQELMPERNLQHAPLIQVKLIMQNTLTPLENHFGLFQMLVEEATGDTLEAESPAAIATTAQLDLTLFVADLNEGLHLAFVYSEDLFESQRIARMMSDFKAILAEMLTRPEKKIGAVRQAHDDLDSVARTGSLAEKSLTAIESGV